MIRQVARRSFSGRLLARARSPRRLGSPRAQLPRRLGLLAAAGLLLAGSLGCHSGTPAAPEGSKMFLSFAYVPGSQEVLSGNFEAIIQVRVLDAISDVPQVGVGVFFRVESGPGSFVNQGPVRTTGSGRAQSLLIGAGATEGNEVTAIVSSGNVEIELAINVLAGSVSGGPGTQSQVPRACFTRSLSTRTLSIDVTCSTDPDCPGGRPDTFDVDWGDGSTDQDRPYSQSTAMHTYTRAGTYNVTLTVTDCQDLTDSATESQTIP